MLDIEVAGAIAPKAKIVVYFAPNTDQGFLDAITQAVNDTVNKPSVISISWGGPESSWTSQALQEFDQEFQDAATMGISICIAAGDHGSSDGVNDGQPHVDFPASSPNVLACGGTTLNASDTTIESEVVWNEPNDGATGGGVSDVFPLPAYQDNAGVPPAADSSQNDRPGRARRRRRRRPGHRLFRAHRRREHRHRGYQRRRAALGGPDRLLEPGPRQIRRLLQPDHLRLQCFSRRLSRHHQRQQRRVLRRPRLGRLHRTRRRRRQQAAPGPLAD